MGSGTLSIRGSNADSRDQRATVERTNAASEAPDRPERRVSGRLRMVPGALGAGDRVTVALTAVVALVLYRQTLAPSVVALFDDTLEFPLAAERLAVLHPTGYPLYALLSGLFARLPVGELAFRVNLLSAVAGALAVSGLAGLVLALAVGDRKAGDRVGAVVGALLLAGSSVFWSQAVVAEVYTLAAALAILAVLATLRAIRLGTGWSWVALTIGLGLAHHRTFVLLLPALAAAAVAFGAVPPLRCWRIGPILRTWWSVALGPLLYLYLPLRGEVGSIDGAYRNDLPTFLAWVTGAVYRDFLADNPLARAGSPLPAYLDLVVAQVTPLGLAFGAVGLVWLAARSWPLLLLLAIWYTPAAAFAVLYRVADPDVFALPSLLPLFAASGVGVVAIGRGLGAAVARLTPPSRLVGRFGLALVLLATLLLPLRVLTASYDDVDLSAELTVRSYGLDVLAQPLPASSAILGLLGEASLFRYLQTALGARPDIAVRFADAEDARQAAVETALAEGRDVYLTRPLPGLAERYHLTGVGPLIAVERVPTDTLPPGVRPVNRQLGELELLGYTSEIIGGYGLGPGGPSDIRPAARTVRVTLYWRAAGPTAHELMTFVHFGESFGERWAQSDSRPVRGAYPTTLWRPGAIVADVHDLPLPLGTPPGDYVLVAGVYRSAGDTGILPETVRETRLGPQFLDSRPGGYTRARMDLNPTFARFNGVTLIGQRLPGDVVRPGGQLTIETLWRGERELATSLTLTAELVGDSRTVPLGSSPLGGRYTTVRWQPGEIVRDRETFRLPVDLPDGRYQLRLSLGEGTRHVLGTITVVGRERLFFLPRLPSNRVNVRFGGGAELIGWSASLLADSPEPRAEVVLYWRSAGALESDYSVFVHLVNMNRVAAQHDGPPAEGAAPTTSWVANEYISDRHVVPLPSGIPPYQLRVVVGMYDPTTGRRLQSTRGDSVDLGPLRFDP